MNEYKTVYEVTDEWIKMSGLFTLFFLYKGVMEIKQYSKTKDTLSQKDRTVRLILGWIFTIFGFGAACFIIPYQIIGYFNTRELFEQKQYLVVEGMVKDFEPMPKDGHGQESFSVGKVKFAYSDYQESYYGFNETKVYGGPMDEGKQVRISYYNNGRQNIILKLEIREKQPK